MKEKKVGIVGVGIMGAGMADNFLKNGYTVYLWNRTRKSAERFEKKGAILCKTPFEVSRKSDLVFEVTANDKSSKKVWLGKKGIIEGADSETVLVASSTLSISWTDDLITRCKKQKLRFMDIPLTGGRIGAETGNLTLLCGGDKKILLEITPALKAISGKIFHFGSAGHGMRYKLILNYIQGSHIIAFGQAMRLAKQNKMDLDKVAEGLADRPGGVITGIAKNTYFKDPDPVTFSIEWITKDLTYAKKFAKNVDMPMLDVVFKEYKKAMKSGYSDKDWASINKLLEKNN